MYTLRRRHDVIYQIVCVRSSWRRRRPIWTLYGGGVVVRLYITYKIFVLLRSVMSSPVYTPLQKYNPSRKWLMAATALAGERCDLGGLGVYYRRRVGWWISACECVVVHDIRHAALLYFLINRCSYILALCLCLKYIRFVCSGVRMMYGRLKLKYVNMKMTNLN